MIIPMSLEIPETFKTIRIMHPNPKITDKVSMELINRHIVNRYLLVQQFYTFYPECIPVTLNKQVSYLEVQWSDRQHGFGKSHPFHG